MLDLLSIILGKLIFIVEGKIFNMLRQLFLFSMTFQFTITNKKISDINVSRCCIYNPPIEMSKYGINSQYSMLAFHKENTASQKVISKEYLQPLCQHIWYFSTLFSPDVQMEDIANIICQIFYYSIKQFLLQVELLPRGTKRKPAMSRLSQKCIII